MNNKEIARRTRLLTSIRQELLKVPFTSIDGEEVRKAVFSVIDKHLVDCATALADNADPQDTTNANT